MSQSTAHPNNRIIFLFLLSTTSIFNLLPSFHDEQRRMGLKDSHRPEGQGSKGYQEFG